MSGISFRFTIIPIFVILRWTRALESPNVTTIKLLQSTYKNQVLLFRFPSFFDNINFYSLDMLSKLFFEKLPLLSLTY